LFRVKNRTIQDNTCVMLNCPIFGSLNNVCLTILDNIEITVLRRQIIKLKIHKKNDRMSFVFKKVNGKIRRRKLNRLGHRIALLTKRFYINKQ